MISRFSRLDRARVVRLCLLGAAVVFALAELARSSYLRFATGMVDFRVLYCVGRVVLAGGDPYLVEPLRSCEHAYADPSIAGSPNIVYPFALPPYVVAPFAALALLPFTTAAWSYEIAAVVALVAAAVLLSRALDLPPPAVAAAIVVSVGLPSLALGQLVPFELAFIAATAFALVRGKHVAAGVFAALTMLEPHIGVFVVASVALFAPRTRVAVLVSAAALALAAFAEGGTRWLTTFPAELRLQALAEAHDDAQYSLTAALAWLGVPVQYALLAGSVSTLLAFVLSLVLSRAVARVSTPAALAVLPPACAVVAGSYIHITQIGLAVPAAFLLARYSRTDAVATRLAVAGLVLLAVPWPHVAAEKPVTAAALLVIAVLLRYAGASYAHIAAAVAACWIVLWPLQNSLPPALARPVLPRAAPGALASTVWIEVAPQINRDSPRTYVIKLPTWLGLAATIGAAIRLTDPRRRRLGEAPPSPAPASSFASSADSFRRG
ncbi:MAG TPA: hypothetical protein VHS78_14695 [Candidatus Elarobacter sp.]|jgi:hypothetical protein|nr:hypothetical protein [Candidatus Elarobacter sp.]